MRTVKLEGGSVTLRERQDVRVRQRQMLEAASVVAAPAIQKIPRAKDNPSEVDWEQLDKAGLSYDEMQTLLQLQNVAIVALIVAWTFDEPVPASIDDVLEMPADRYEQLSQAVRETGAGIVAGETNFEPSDPKAPDFPDRPIPGSEGSELDSKETPGLQSEPATVMSYVSGTSSVSAN
jgi:hypothetical protein